MSVVGTRLGDAPATLRRLPGVLNVVDATTLSSAQVFTATEALRKVPGVNVRDEEGFGLRPNIGIRGLNPTRSSKVLLLEDGVPFTIAPYGDNASYYHPPIERFESVEVLKGSGQIAYGPVTVGGIVNYVTPDVPERTTGVARLAFGSRDYANLSGYAGTMKGRFGASLDYMRKQGDGAREHVYSRLDDVTGKVQWLVSEDHTLIVKGNFYGEDSTVTYSGLTEAEYAADPRQNPFRNDAFDRQCPTGVDSANVGASVIGETKCCVKASVRFHVVDIRPSPSSQLAAFVLEATGSNPSRRLEGWNLVSRERFDRVEDLDVARAPT